MKALLLFILFPLEFQQSEHSQLVANYLNRLKDTLHGQTTELQVNQLLDLYAKDIIYEHPKVGIKLEGKDTIRKGMMSFLSSYAGTPSDVKLTIKNEIHTPAVSVVHFHISFQTQSAEGVKEVTRDPTLVFEFKGGKIKRVLDYW